MPAPLHLPGDKSISHRLLLFAALARGTSRLSGLLTSLDVRSSAAALRALGARVSPLRPGALVTVTGEGRFRPPTGRLHCGNSGTTARLLLGALAAHPFRAELTGDASLRRRPMQRVTEPLTLMGARFAPPQADRLPLAVEGGPLASVDWALPVSSAQLKSALLLAGVAGGVDVGVREPAGRSRDHTERLLRAHGYSVEERDGWIRFAPTGALIPVEARVPGDPSSAAFLVAAGLLGRGEVSVEAVGLNPTRTGFLRVIERMGGRVRVEDEETWTGEPVGRLVVAPGDLRGTEVTPGEIPGLIDEIPALAVLAARARGPSRFREVGELRVKESDRLELIAANLRTLGAEAAVEGEDLVVAGGWTSAPRGRVRTEGDHRIAMAFGLLRTLPGADVTVDDPACVAVSFPGFWDALREVGR